MKTKILITGGSGLLGMKLSKFFSDKGFEISHLSRSKNSKALFPSYYWDPSLGEFDPEALNVDYIINLAGAGVGDSRWTTSRKQVITDSRVLGTKLLFEKLKEHGTTIKGLVNASAIGIYPYDTFEMVDETHPAADHFLAQVVKDWEQETDDFATLDIPVAKMRIGVVLDRDGGALPKMAQPIKLGVGSPLGSGKQVMSWIHVEDLVRAFDHCIENDLWSTYNLVAPNPVSNEHLTHSLAKAMKRSIVFPNVPSFVLKMIFGEMSDILLKGTNASSIKLQQSGFQFQFETVEKALKDLY